MNSCIIFIEINLNFIFTEKLIRNVLLINFAKLLLLCKKVKKFYLIKYSLIVQIK